MGGMNKTRPAPCHPERLHYGHGLCSPCYQVANRQRFQSTRREYQRAHYKPEQHRKSRLHRQFGLSIDAYDSMLKQQDGLCAICKREPGGRWNRLAVDHDHNTDEVRGLLCHRCNQMLGQSNDDPAIFDAAADYLRAKRWTKKGTK